MSTFIEEMPILVHQLINHYGIKNGISPDNRMKQYLYILNVLSSIMRPQCEGDVIACSLKLIHHMKKQGLHEDVYLFNDLFEKLSVKKNLKNLWAHLYFICAMAKSNKETVSSDFTLENPLNVFPSTPIVFDLESSRSNAHIEGNLAITSKNSHQLKIPTCEIHSVKSLLPRSDDALELQRLIISTTLSGTDLKEMDLLHDVIFILQGLQGRFIKFDSSTETYSIRFVSPNSPMYDLVSKICEVGWLYHKVNNFIKQKKSLKNYGLVGDNFLSALNSELSEFHRFIALLDAERIKSLSMLDGDSKNVSKITLRQIYVYLMDFKGKLSSIVSLLEFCENTFGGQLLSVIHSYTLTGNPICKDMMSKILSTTWKPLNHTLVHWIYEGKLVDRFGEFFVACNEEVEIDNFWKEKYHIRHCMMPGLVSPDVAEKILQIGKSINFIRVVCKDSEPMKWCEEAKSSDNGHKTYKEINFRSMPELVNSVHILTCRYLLDLMIQRYQLKEHWTALKRYMLLGQGDLIRHLMDLLKEHLCKPASNIMIHNMSSILETAIRSTNAQFHKPEFLRRLDCKLLPANSGDTGWDIFALNYRFDGPLITIFTPENMLKYSKLFKFMWKFKRMEYLLSEGWIDQLHARRVAFFHVPEAACVMQTSYEVNNQMVHFIKQMQHYFMFEVLECLYADLMKKVEESKDFDTLLTAHDKFLDQLLSMCFLQSRSNELFSTIMSIFELIQNFDTLRKNMFEYLQLQAEEAEKRNQKASKNAEKGEWGKDSVSVKLEAERKLCLMEHLKSKFHKPMLVIRSSIQSLIGDFITMILCQRNFTLKQLTFRLDFNGFYIDSDEGLKRMIRASSFVHS